MSSAVNAYETKRVKEACYRTLKWIKTFREDGIKRARREEFNSVLRKRRWFGLRAPLTGMAAARKAVQNFNESTLFYSRKSYWRQRFWRWEEDIKTILRACEGLYQYGMINLSIEQANSLHWK